jgi:sulfite reductase (ferredoxin)
LGRKVKIAFSNSEEDTAYTFIHDIGFIPKLNSDGGKGFKVLIGGGLGAQPFLAQTAYEFFPADEILTFVESVHFGFLTDMASAQADTKPGSNT